ncbi:MAG: ATP-binding protein [Opitutaceae bacterium]
MNPANLVAFVASLAVGTGVLFANAKRNLNRAFFLLTLNVAAWMASVMWLTDPANPDPVLWIRIASAFGALFPFLLWVIKDCAKGGEFSWSYVRRGWVWLAVAGIMIAICFSPLFIPPESTREHNLRGFGWSLFAVVNGAAYVILIVQAIFDVRTCKGIQKIELQALMFGGAAAGFVGLVLATLGPVFGMRMLSSALPMVITAFYGFTAWGITTQKVFDARDLFRSVLRASLSVGIVALIISAAVSVNPAVIPRAIVVLICAILITIVFNLLSLRVLRDALLGVDMQAEAIRAAVIKAGRDEFDHDVLVKRFSAILEAWSRSECAYFLDRDKGAFTHRRVSLPLDSPAASELLRVSWATPESLQRQRDAGARHVLSGFMREHALGVMICARDDDGDVPFIVALKMRRDRAPFKWSEVKLLQEWVGMIANTLSRISLTQQARESEQLRTAGLLGASLAHEIRNPLVTLKTIAQSASTRFNDPEFRRLLIELVPAEIERIEGLVSGLMDLGRPQHPHFERVHMNEIVETSVKLVQPKALDESVNLVCELAANPDEIFADRASIRQVILNLVMNAIQAVEGLDSKREVLVKTHAGDGQVVLEISDNGAGMPAEVRKRLFQPFTTSNKTSGIGLGLAITADLVKLHHGQIDLVEGRQSGTTFRVTLPCQQPSY